MKPFPISSAPVSGLGILFTAAFVLEAIAFDLWIFEDPDVPRAFEAAKAFFYRKSAQPALFLKLILLLLLLGGVFSYVRAFVAVFISDASQKRKISDAIGFFLFVANVYIGMFQARPREIEIGKLWIHDDGHWTSTRILQAFSDLYFYHLLNVFLSFGLLIQQYVSFNTQKNDKQRKSSL
jgi:hypothetical protein